MDVNAENIRENFTELVHIFGSCHIINHYLKVDCGSNSGNFKNKQKVIFLAKLTWKKMRKELLKKHNNTCFYMY